jgi:DNA-binding NtrC family response regulator
MRVGSGRARTIDLRVVAATNRDLETMVRDGTFREDLYYRLRVVEVRVPPLRERLDDLPAIVAALLPRLAARNGGETIDVRPDALAALARHTWPGNIRELENVLERAIVLTGATTIGAADLLLDARRAPPAVDAPPADEGTGHREYLDAVERARLIAALEAADGNRARAARNLGIPRTTLINKLRRHGIGSA